MANGIVTLCDNNSYAKGALVLARSLRNVGTKCDLVCLISNAISADMKFELEQVYNRLVTVDIINSEDSANLALLNRPELGSTLTKLHIWVGFIRFFAFGYPSSFSGAFLSKNAYETLKRN